MFDCAKDVLAFHDEKVTLPQTERNEMRERRDGNRKRLKNGLKKNDKPAPRECRSQGSYAMKTMVQYSKKNYDVDDGAYFEKADLVGARGADMTSLDARKMVRDAVDDGSFAKAPETRENCVRVFYDAGYHVDIPVYRRVVVGEEGSGLEEIYHELASSEWKRSDARDVTKWFEGENSRQSPDTTNGQQLRRITRDIKKFAKSLASWESPILGGFGITALVVECYRSNIEREDSALYETMKAIRDRLNYNLVVNHPVTLNETITKGDNDSKARFLREKLSDAIDWLAPLFEGDCTREEALKCWDKVYATDFFIGRSEKGSDSVSASARTSAAAGMSLRATVQAKANPDAVRKEGGGRYA